MMNELTSAQEWFSLGTRVEYDPGAKQIVGPGEATGRTDAVQVREQLTTICLGLDDWNLAAD